MHMYTCNLTTVGSQIWIYMYNNYYSVHVSAPKLHNYIKALKALIYHKNFSHSVDLHVWVYVHVHIISECPCSYMYTIIANSEYRLCLPPLSRMAPGRRMLSWDCPPCCSPRA